ncbi:MAG: hypothetical protein ACREBU_05250 [Nitrososphaera sp.]
MNDRYSIEAGICVRCKEYQAEAKLQEHHANQAILQSTKSFFESNLQVIIEKWDIHIQYHEHTFIPSRSNV